MSECFVPKPFKQSYHWSLNRMSDEPSITMTQMLNSGAGSTDSVDRKPGYKPYNDDSDFKKARISSASSDVSGRYEIWHKIPFI